MNNRPTMTTTLDEKRNLLLNEVLKATQVVSVVGATEATLLLVEANTAAAATVLVSSSTTGAGTIPAGSKAATVFIDGAGGSINSVARPDGWSQSFEFNNDTLPEIAYDGGGTATMYVDILT